MKTEYEIIRDTANTMESVKDSPVDVQYIRLALIDYLTAARDAENAKEQTTLFKKHLEYLNTDEGIDED